MHASIGVDCHAHNYSVGIEYFKLDHYRLGYSCSTCHMCWSALQAQIAVVITPPLSWRTTVLLSFLLSSLLMSPFFWAGKIKTMFSQCIWQTKLYMFKHRHQNGLNVSLTPDWCGTQAKQVFIVFHFITSSLSDIMMIPICIVKLLTNLKYIFFYVRDVFFSALFCGIRNQPLCTKSAA